ncbi:hypothetical protein Tcan_00430, partial [Toxocara canis]
MNVVELLLPLIDDCRHNFGDCSLVLKLQRVQIDTNGASNGDDNKIDCKFGEKFANIKRTLQTRPIIAICKQILYMISEPSININDLLRPMQQIHIQPGQRSLQYSLNLRAWKHTTKSIVLLEVISEDDEAITDKTLLQLIDFALFLHIGKDPLVTSIAEAFFPIAIFGNLYIVCDYSYHNDLTFDIRIFDEDGWKLAELLSLTILDDNLSNGRCDDFAGLLSVDNDKTKADPKTLRLPSNCNVDKSAHSGRFEFYAKLSATKKQSLENHLTGRCDFCEDVTPALETKAAISDSSAGVPKPESDHQSDRQSYRVVEQAKQLNNPVYQIPYEAKNCDRTEIFSQDVPFQQNDESRMEKEQKTAFDDRLFVSEVVNNERLKNELRIRIRRILSEFIVEKQIKDNKSFIWLGFDSLKLATFEAKLKEE